MDSKCYDCPWTKEYIDIGRCPNCGAKKLLMTTRTCMATCDICNMTFGIPMAIDCLCHDEKANSRYRISFLSTPNKQQLLDLSKLIGFSGVETYHLFQKGSPIHIDDIPMVTTYQIRNYFRATEIEITISPPIDRYHLFEECWNIG